MTEKEWLEQVEKASIDASIGEYDLPNIFEYARDNNKRLTSEFILETFSKFKRFQYAGNMKVYIKFFLFMCYLSYIKNEDKDIFYKYQFSKPSIIYVVNKDRGVEFAFTELCNHFYHTGVIRLTDWEKDIYYRSNVIELLENLYNREDLIDVLVNKYNTIKRRIKQ